MKHPNREQWMAFLYDEAGAVERVELQAHLRDCPACQKQFAAWKHTGRQLDEWVVPTRGRRFAWSGVSKWAAAAAIVGVVGLGGFRMISLQNEVQQLRAEMQDTVKRQVAALATEASAEAKANVLAEAQSLVTGVAQRLEEKRLSDQQALIAAVQRLSDRQTHDYASLRQQLETVAVYAETGLQNAQDQIATMAASPMLNPLNSESDSNE